MDALRNFFGRWTNQVQEGRLSSQPVEILDNICEHLDVATLINIRGAATPFAPSVRTELTKRTGEAKCEELATMMGYASEPMISEAAERELLRRQVQIEVIESQKEPTAATKKTLSEFLRNTPKIHAWLKPLAAAIAYHSHTKVNDIITTRAGYIPVQRGLEQLCELAITAKNTVALDALIRTEDSSKVDHSSLISSIKAQGDASFESDAILAVERFGRR